MALRNQPYFPLYVQDYLTDERLLKCKLSSQGVYIRILCHMHKSETYGVLFISDYERANNVEIIESYKAKLKQNKNCAYLNYDLSQIAESVHVVCALTGYGGDVIMPAIIDLLAYNVIVLEHEFIIQKRMYADGLNSLKKAEAGKKGGQGRKKEVVLKIINKAKHKQNTEYEYESEYENEINKKGAFRKKLDLSPLFEQVFMKHGHGITEDYDYIKDSFALKYELETDGANGELWPNKSDGQIANKFATYVRTWNQNKLKEKINNGEKNERIQTANRIKGSN